MPKINYTRPELGLINEAGSLLARWELIRDCIAGEDVIKKKSTRYLPQPNAHDCSPENDARYRSYIARASFYNVTDNTLRGLVGQVFAADPVAEYPDALEVMQEDADGSGVTLTQQVKRALSNTLAFGRTGVFTDFPAAKPDGEPFTAEEVQQGAAKPTLHLYNPEQIINWRMRLVNGKSLLSLVVISTDYTAHDDGFEIQSDREWRVLSLDESNLYVHEVWRKRGANAGKGATEQDEDFYVHETVYPTDYQGNRLPYIPFTFIGSLNNNEMPDKPPLYDLATLNIAHYHNSADYEESVYMVGSPTPYFAGLTKPWVDDVMKGNVDLGSRAAIPLPAGASAGLLVASENGMAAEAMLQKERRMVALGAQLVEQKEVQRTLGEAKMEKAVVNSTLVQCAKNVASAYTKALQWACDFYGADPTLVDYQLSTDFAIVRMTPEERTATIADFQAGLISWSEVRYAYRQSGLAYLEDGIARAEIDKDMAEAVNLDKEDPEDNEDDPPPVEE